MSLMLLTWFDLQKKIGGENFLNQIYDMIWISKAVMK